MPMASDAILVRPRDEVPFTCQRCGNCCRNVEEQIMLEPLDAYQLGRFLCQHGGDIQSIEDVYSRYAEPMLLAQGFPIFTLKTIGSEHSCVFLQSGRCQVYEGRPRVCRLYPFSATGGQRGRRFAFYQCLDCHASHFNGSKVSVRDWMYQNFTKNAREFVEADTAAMTELGRLLRELGPKGQQDCLFQLLYYRYYNFDLDRPFMEQYQANHQALLEELHQRLDRSEKES